MVGAASLAVLSLAARGEIPFKRKPINYLTAPVHDPAARLQEKLQARSVELRHEDRQGYLRSVLELLNVPVSSQVLVFSKTSVQRTRIAPETPRAMYFNDDVYVGFAQGSDVLEFSAVDPELGGMFYVCPNALVARNVPNEPDRRSCKVWKEGKAPDVVFEVTSRKTRKQDLTKKFEIDRDVLRVREYFLFDPFEEYLDPSLQGYHLIAGSYEPIPMIKGGMPSEVLGLELQRDDVELRFYNPEIGKLLPAVHELDREIEIRDLARREAELARREAELARREAEAEIERLRRENEALRRRLPEGE